MAIYIINKKTQPGKSTSTEKVAGASSSTEKVAGMIFSKKKKQRKTMKTQCFWMPGDGRTGAGMPELRRFEILQ